MKKIWDKWWKKGDVMGIPIHYLLIFVAFLLVLLVIIIMMSRKQGGLLGNLFDSMRGAG